jgi:hypothetical protein
MYPSVDDQISFCKAQEPCLGKEKEMEGVHENTEDPAPEFSLHVDNY